MPVSIDRFRGHCMFGSITVVLATWWTIRVLQRYFKQLSKNKPFYNTTWHRTKFCTRIPVEPVVKLFIGLSTGSVMWFDFIRSLQLDDGMAATAGPHAVAAGVYIWLPVVEILQFYQCTVVGMFESITFVAHILGMLAAVIAFGFHAHGRLFVDAHIHQLLALCFMLVLIAVILEYKCRNSVVVSLAKCYLYILSGLWTISAAFMLASHVDSIPAWDLEKSDNVVLSTCLLIFLMTVALLYMFVISCLVGRPYKHLLREVNAKCDGVSTNGIANGITYKTV